MNLTLATVGSRGDVEPYLALGLGLQRAGHAVQIATDGVFEAMVRAQGLGFFPVQMSPGKALQEDVRAIGSNPLQLTRWFKRNFNPLARQYFADLKAACAGTDAVLCAPLAFAAIHVAEARRMPALAAYLQPVTPTRAFPSPSVPGVPAWLPFRGQSNWLSFRLGNLAFFAMLKNTIDECRRDILGLPPVPWKAYAAMDVSPAPIVYGYSAHVLPKPPDWDDWLHVTGYWFLDEPSGWQPPARLLDFLAAGPPPVYAGFGSMIDREAETLTRLVVAALGQAGQRGILLGGWNDLGAGEMPDTILHIADVPHAWLFPRMAAVVHHGGAGTTAAGLRAGVPSLVVPFFADQPFWGRRVHELGAGPRPIPRARLTAERLAQGIRAATGDATMRRRAAELGTRIRAEDGVGQAVAVINRFLDKPIIANFR